MFWLLCYALWLIDDEEVNGTCVDDRWYAVSNSSVKWQRTEDKIKKKKHKHTFLHMQAYRNTNANETHNHHEKWKKLNSHNVHK